MSLPIDIRLRSDKRLVSVKQLKADIIKAMHNAVTSAYREVWTFFRPSIAKKTGAFRAGLDAGFENQLAKTFGRKKFTIS